MSIILKKSLRFSLKFLLYFTVFILLYLMLAYLLSRIPIGPERTSEKKKIQLFIKSNGVHTDLILPIQTKEFDWRKKLPFSHTRGKDSNHRFVAFGWGDKGFYLNTPTWGDLTFTTAFKAASGLGSTAMHVTFYPELTANDSNCVSVYLTKKQHLSLIQYIQNSFQQTKKGAFKHIQTNAVYSDNDAFYEAKGTYSLFSTCNTWTNNGLKTTGQKAALWTAFQEGIFCHYLP